MQTIVSMARSWKPLYLVWYCQFDVIQVKYSDSNSVPNILGLTFLATCPGAPT